MPNKIVIHKDIPTRSSFRSAIDLYKQGLGYDLPYLAQTSNSFYIPIDILNRMKLNKSFSEYSDEDYNNLNKANDFYAYYNDGLVNGAYTGEELNNAFQAYLAGKYSTADEIDKAAGGNYYAYEPSAQPSQIIDLSKMDPNSTVDVSIGGGGSTPTVQSQPDGSVQARSPLSRRDLRRNAEKLGISGRNFRKIWREGRRFGLRGQDLRNAYGQAMDEFGTPENRGIALRRDIIDKLYYTAHPDKTSQVSQNQAPQAAQTSSTALNYDALAKQALSYYMSDLSNRAQARTQRQAVTSAMNLIPSNRANPSYFNVDVSKYNTPPEDFSVEETLPEGAPKPPITPRYTDGYDFTSLGSFSNAFGAARARGLKSFTWNNKDYNTKIATTIPEIVAWMKSQGKSQQEIDAYITSRNANSEAIHAKELEKNRKAAAAAAIAGHRVRSEKNSPTGSVVVNPDGTERPAEDWDSAFSQSGSNPDSKPISKRPSGSTNKVSDGGGGIQLDRNSQDARTATAERNKRRRQEGFK